MTDRIYFNVPTMAKLGRRTRAVGGLFLDAETALVQADKEAKPELHKARERLALERLNNAKEDLLAIIADIDKAIALGNL